MKDYQVSNVFVPSQPYVQANAMLLHCPKNNDKYNLQHYTPPSPNTFACSVNPASVIPEPTSYSQIVKDSRWVDAMNKELQALESNNTWTVV